MSEIHRFSSRRQRLDQAFCGTFMGHMRQGTMAQRPHKRPRALAGSNAMNIASTAYRRVDEAQRNPPNIAGMSTDRAVGGFRRERRLHPPYKKRSAHAVAYSSAIDF